MRNKSQEILDNIDKGLEEAQHITIEHAVGSAVLKGLMTAQDAMDVLDYYEGVFVSRESYSSDTFLQ